MCFDELYDSIDMITTIDFLSVCCSNTGQQNVSLFCFVYITAVCADITKHYQISSHGLFEVIHLMLYFILHYLVLYYRRIMY